VADGDGDPDSACGTGRLTIDACRSTIESVSVSHSTIDNRQSTFPMPLTYADYLALDRLLQLQRPRSEPPEHDEMLFIVIHQVYELWFKLLLHETDRLKWELSGGRLWEAVAVLKRMRTVMKTLVGQLDILETMTPLSFASFRDRLDTASGFQSSQFRELEFALGYKRPALARIGSPVPDTTALARRLAERSVVDHCYDFLAQRGLSIPAELRDKDVTEPTRPSEALQAELLRAYREQPDLVGLFELMLDFDEGLQEWRYRHVKLVERTIGAKQGTGGSAGVEFLRNTMWVRLFPDLWAIRHRM
jgi:tryptophan 2,3-dioxygenase